jgi:hypothetical protein
MVVVDNEKTRWVGIMANARYWLRTVIIDVLCRHLV